MKEGPTAHYNAKAKRFAAPLSCPGRITSPAFPAFPKGFTGYRSDVALSITITWKSWTYPAEASSSFILLTMPVSSY
jgi:hypothetical protein